MKRKVDLIIEVRQLASAGDAEEAWSAVMGRQAAHKARLGDWSQLVDRLRSSAPLGDEERAALIDLFDGKLATAKLKIDKRRTPRAEHPDRIDVVNFVLEKTYEGTRITAAVEAAEVEFDLKRVATIWEWLREDAPWMMSLPDVTD